MDQLDKFRLRKSMQGLPNNAVNVQPSPSLKRFECSPIKGAQFQKIFAPMAKKIRHRAVESLDQFSSMDIYANTRRRPIPNQQITQLGKSEERRVSDSKVLVYDVFQERAGTKISEFNNQQVKRSSLPTIRDRQPCNPTLDDSVSHQINDVNRQKLLIPFSLHQVPQSKGIPEQSERILDLLMLNTCELKRIFQKPQSKTRRKVIVQGRIPEDFFSILRQF